MSVEIKFKKPKYVPICEVRKGEFFYYEGTLFVKVGVDSSNGTYIGVSVGKNVRCREDLFRVDSDTLVQPVDVCIEIQ